MNVQAIESKDLTIGDLFKSFYVVPDYQREFVWGEQQVEQLLEDIRDEFSNGAGGESSEYFIGSIVVCPRDDGVLELIDGQQRMTTLFLLFCAVRDRLKSMPGTEPIEALRHQIASSDVDENGQNVYRYRVDLQYEDSGDVLIEIAMGKPPSEVKPTRSVDNIRGAHKAIMAFLGAQFGEDSAELKRFYAYLARRVKLIRVKTASVAHALKIFETINDRGVGLDSMDLLKNLMFMHSPRTEFDRLKTRWKDLVDTLYSVNEKPLRFLRYFIFAEFSVDRLREDEIYGWFVKNEKLCGYKEQPRAFVDRLVEAAAAYANFLKGKNARGEDDRYVDNIRYLSGAAKQHLILLLAGRKLTPGLFTILSREVENLFFAYIITRETTREFERNFAKWAPLIRNSSSEEELRDFVEQYITPEKRKLATRFKLAFEELREDAIQRYRLKYILAKLAQHVDEAALGQTQATTVLGNYVSGTREIEHIFPQNPSPEALAAFDQPEELANLMPRLGNLTLLEKSINASISNGPFPQKQPDYDKSVILLTKSLGSSISVGSNTAYSRVARLLETFEEWSSEAIGRRQAMLGRLAFRTWDMPEPAPKE